VPIINDANRGRSVVDEMNFLDDEVLISFDQCTRSCYLVWWSKISDYLNWLSRR
jgi:hypothetical protein